jgi:hypothetical protein
LSLRPILWVALFLPNVIVGTTRQNVPG